MISGCNTTKQSPSVFPLCLHATISQSYHARALWFRISVWPTGFWLEPVRISVADWDGDGHLDLIVIFAGMRWAVNMSFYQNQSGNGFLMRLYALGWAKWLLCCLVIDPARWKACLVSWLGFISNRWLGTEIATHSSRLGWWWLHRSHPGARRALLSQETWSGKGPDG